MHPPHPAEGAHGSLFTPVPGEVFDTHRYYFRFRAFNTEVGLGNWRLTVAHGWHFLGDGDERWTSVDHGYYDLKFLYRPPSTAPCQSVSSSAFTKRLPLGTPCNCIDTCHLSLRDVLFDGLGWFLDFLPLLHSPQPTTLASPKSAALVPSALHPVIFKKFRVYHNTWLLTFILVEYC